MTNFFCTNPLRVLTLFCGTCLYLASPLAAADWQNALQQCKTISDATQRLLCYDNIQLAPLPAAPLTTAPLAATAPVAAPAKTINAKTTDTFGVEHLQPIEAPAELKVQVKSVKINLKNQLEVTLVNGQLWRQLDSGQLSIQAGDYCVIERGAFNSFFLGNGRGNRKIKVRRVE